MDLTHGSAAHWAQISDDPNTSEVKRWRADRIKRAWAGTIDDRVGYIASLSTGKRVLDVGVVDHTSGAQDAKKSNWLHGRVAEAADNCLGVDLLAEPIEKLKAQGFNVRHCDITRDSISDPPFELIVAGEVIEHLGHPAALIEAVARNLQPKGRFVMSTPNPYYLNRVYTNLNGKPYDSVDHVALYWPWGMAELAERAGLRLDRYCGIQNLHRMPRTLRGRFLFKIATMFGIFKPNDLAWANSIIYEFIKPTS